VELFHSIGQHTIYLKYLFTLYTLSKEEVFMAQCPKCPSSNTIATEEVFTRKGRAYYRFWQTIWVFFFIGGGFVIEQIAYGFIAAFI
jgi:hypothetical protein